MSVAGVFALVSTLVGGGNEMAQLTVWIITPIVLTSVLNPIVTIIVIRPYREAITKKWRRARNEPSMVRPVSLTATAVHGSR
jgi:hypothetical protein